MLQYIVNWGPTENLCRELLTRRTLLLFLLATGQRVQTARLLKRSGIYWTDTDCVITYTSRLKNRVPGKNGLVLKLKKFSDSALCIYTHLKQYESLENAAEPYMFSTIRQPFPPPPAADTFRRYVRESLHMARVDIDTYAPHSVRHAATSAAQDLTPQ